MVSVVRTFSKYQSFEIRQSDGKRRKFESIVFANIAEMANYATPSEADDKLSNGKLEVVIFSHMSKWRVLLKALRATTQGLGDQPSANSYEFTTLKPLSYQIDGEVKSIDAGTLVKVERAPSVLPILG